MMSCVYQNDIISREHEEEQVGYVPAVHARQLHHQRETGRWGRGRGGWGVNRGSHQLHHQGPLRRPGNTEARERMQ
jgi:hypothetical protein